MRDQHIVYANQALADLVGMPREAIVGLHFHDRIAPEDRERMSERQARRLRGEPVPRSYEFQLLRADGARRLVEIWVTTADDDVIFQLHDRTGRVRRQEKLSGLARLGVALAAEPSEDAVFAALAREIPLLGVAMVRLALLDGAGPLDGPGERMRVVAISAPGDLVERFFAAAGLGLPEMVGAFGPVARDVWRDGGAYLDDMPLATARFFPGDPAQTAGAEITRGAMLARGVMLRIDLGGAPAELLLLMADWLLPEHLPACRLFAAQISAALDVQRLFADLRRSYADLRRAQEQLVQRERLAAIGELAAVVAHEVRNPLGVLFNSLGAFRKLLGEGVEGTARTLVEIMAEETARINHIVGDLLDFARPTTPALHREPLAPLIEEAVDAAIGERRADITFVRAIDDLPPVPMDPRLVRQAILNIASNAVQAMPAGGTLTLRLRIDDLHDLHDLRDLDGPAPVPAARIDVEDTGTGIPKDVEPRIFEPFFTTRATGTGLGLAVVKRIVDSHRGRLGVVTTEGKGTTFTVWLPLGEGSFETPAPA